MPGIASRDITMLAAWQTSNQWHTIRRKGHDTCPACSYLYPWQTERLMHKGVQVLLNLWIGSLVHRRFRGKGGIAPATNHKTSIVQLSPVLIAFMSGTRTGKYLFSNWLCDNNLAAYGFDPLD